MLVKVINVADSIFDVDLLIPLFHDMTSAAENSANNSQTIRFRRLLIPEMELACKNSWGNQILSFSDIYYDIYGHLSI